VISENDKSNRHTFDVVAPYYDELMSHVNYPGWVCETRHVAACLGREPLRLLDLACGTATFATGLARETGWQVIGLDSSVEMVRCGRAKVHDHDPVQLLVAKMQKPALRGGFDMAVSLFDSVNFILTDDELRDMFCEVYHLLAPDGLFFFDAITERNVQRNFEGEPWIEPLRETTCKWSSAYDTNRRIVYTTLDIHDVDTVTVIERLYSDTEIRDALADAGFGIVAHMEAHTWDEPTVFSERIEYIVCRDDAGRYRHKFPAVREQYKATLPVR